MTFDMRDNENFGQGFENGFERGFKIGLEQGRFEIIQLFVKSGMQLEDKEMIVLGVSEEEYQKAKESLSN